MVSKDSIVSIRILPNAKGTFNEESDFRNFVEKTMISRGGYYYFSSAMMNCPPNTLVLFQYDGMIRAIAVLLDAEKTSVFDEYGVEYAGYYRFATETVEYLENSIDRDTLKKIYPQFKGFSQAKQIIPLEYIDEILNLLFAR